MNAIKPVAETIDTVTLTRGDFEALMAALEDAKDAATFRAFNACLAAKSKDAVLADFLPVEAVERLLSGESPVRIWREQRGMTLRSLAETAGISAGYLSEIENGRKPGSAVALARIARALGLAIEDLLPEDLLADSHA
jgi:DNA-binding XRE family transcriptional regulator